MLSSPIPIAHYIQDTRPGGRCQTAGTSSPRRFFSPRRGAVPAAGLPLRMSMGAKKFYSILNESLFFLSQVKIRFNGIAVPGLQTGFLDSQHRWSWIIGLAANIPYTDVKGIGDGG